MERERLPTTKTELERPADPRLAMDEVQAEPAVREDAQREADDYKEAMAVGRRILKQRHAVFAALAK